MIIYLYKKTHNITGLKYLGKTEKSNPYNYKGSGKYWTAHIKEHGYDVTTEIIRVCESKEELKEWGLYYSKLWNIVNECDSNGKKTWANLIPESGAGTPYGKTYEEIYGLEKAQELKASRRRSNSERPVTNQTRALMKLSGKGKRIGDKNGMFNKTHSDKVKAFLRVHGAEKWTDDMRLKAAAAKSIGTYVTPWGNFVSAVAAVKHEKSTFKDSGTLASYCIDNEKPRKRWNHQTGKELGFSFVPK